MTSSLGRRGHRAGRERSAFHENVDSVFASANDNAAVFSLLFKTGTDMEQALADVTSAVDAVENSFPEDAADPRIQVSAFRDPVSSILIAGPLSQSGLKTIAERMRDDLLNRGLLEVNVQGARNPEIEVEVDEAALRRLGLTPVDVSAAIARRANDLPAGTLGGERAVRTLGTEASARSIADSPIRAEPDGTVIRVRDVAQVTESVPDTGRSIYFQGEPAISLQIRRGPEGDAIRQQAVIREYLEEIRPTLPANITIENYDVRADLILGRVLLLRDNAFYGVLIVLAFLFLFLNMRTAFWIAVGIPVSIAATLGVMWALGLSINCFAVRADPVAGDYRRRCHCGGGVRRFPAPAGLQAGQGRDHRGQAHDRSGGRCRSHHHRRLWGTVFPAGTTGIIASDIPVTVVAVLIASLIECFLVLPGICTTPSSSVSARNDACVRAMVTRRRSTPPSPASAPVLTPVSSTSACACSGPWSASSSGRAIRCWSGFW